MAYDVLVESAAGAPYVGYKRSAFVDARVDADGVRPRAGREGPAPDHRACGRPRRGAARRPGRTSTTIRQAESSQGAGADLAAWPSISGRQSRRSRRARLTDRPTTSDPPVIDQVATREETGSDRPDAHQGCLRAHPGPVPGRARRRGRAVEDDRIVAVGHGLSADGARTIDATDDIVIPGFIDTHRHTWETSIRTCAPDFALITYFGNILDKFAPALPARRCLRGQPVGLARVHQRRASRPSSTGPTS